MAKVGNAVQYRFDSATWIAAIVVDVHASDATKLTLRTFHPKKAITQVSDVVQGTSVGQWREIPVL